MSPVCMVLTTPSNCAASTLSVKHASIAALGGNHWPPLGTSIMVPTLTCCAWKEYESPYTAIKPASTSANMSDSSCILFVACAALAASQVHFPVIRTALPCTSTHCSPVYGALQAYFDSQATCIQRHFRGYWSRKYVHSFYTRKAYLASIAAKNAEVKALAETEYESAVR